jgi:hypothetical protein
MVVVAKFHAMALRLLSLGLNYVSAHCKLYTGVLHSR